MAKIDVVKARIDILKTVLSTVVIGGLVSLALYNIQTSGANFIVVMSAIAVLAIFGRVIAKAFKKELDELERL